MISLSTTTAWFFLIDEENLLQDFPYKTDK